MIDDVGSSPAICSFLFTFSNALTARSRAIPFALELSGDPIERRMREAVNAKVSAVKSSGSPVALYDDLQNRPFLEYPDGRRVYDID